MSEITINPNTVVGVSYQLKLSNGELADEATSEQPLLFIHGIGQTLPDFDSKLSGLSIGDNFEFTLTAEQGYGEHNSNYVVDLEKQIFEGPDVPEDLLTVGNMLPMQDQEGNPLDGKVLEVGDATVKMDFNHPLAGESLNFTGTVLSIREATPEELSHGHVHGEGGVQH